MTLSLIARTVAINCSLRAPDVVLGSNDPDTIKLAQFINEAGQELARRVDWSSLQRTHMIEGTGFNGAFPLPLDFARMCLGLSMTHQGKPVRGGITADEWNAITPVEGVPRYYRILGRDVSFHPFLAEGAVATMLYFTRNWVSEDKDRFGADTDTPLIPERLIEKGAIWRMKRSMGADYSDYLAEYEAAVMDEARADGSERQP